MTNLILGPIVGHVTKNSARIWAHTDQPAQGETAVRCEVFLDSQGNASHLRLSFPNRDLTRSRAHRRLRNPAPRTRPPLLLQAYPRRPKAS